MHNQFKPIHFIYKKRKKKKDWHFSHFANTNFVYIGIVIRVQSGILFILSENENNMQTIAEKKNSRKKKPKREKKKFKMSANKNANKRQRVDYFASSLFFFSFFFSFSFLLWTYPFLLSLFDVIISNSFAILPLEQRTRTQQISQTVCSLFIMLLSPLLVLVW